jgi:hypothetical protein
MMNFGMSESAALDYPLARAFALRNFCTEQNPWSKTIYESDGYIAQQVERLKRLKS